MKKFIGVIAVFLAVICIQLFSQERNPVPQQQNAISFAVVGDVQVKGPSDRWIKTAKWIAEKKPEFWFPVGDLVDEGLNPKQWEAFAEGEKIISAVSKVMPVLGNHEHYLKSADGKNAEAAPKIYFEHFDIPDNGADILKKRCYYVKSNDCLFVVLDTNCIDAGGDPKKLVAEAETPWLRKVLSENKLKWIFIFTHAPFYSSGPHGSESGWLKKEWCLLFDEFGVDAVFSGHTHAFEVTKPLKNGAIVEGGKGTVYYNCAGITYSAKAKGDWYSDSFQKEERKLQVATVEVNGDSAEINTWDIDSGTVISTVTLRKDSSK